MYPSSPSFPRFYILLLFALLLVVRLYSQQESSYTRQFTGGAAVGSVMTTPNSNLFDAAGLPLGVVSARLVNGEGMLSLRLDPHVSGVITGVKKLDVYVNIEYKEDVNGSLSAAAPSCYGYPGYAGCSSPNIVTQTLSNVKLSVTWEDNQSPLTEENAADAVVLPGKRVHCVKVWLASVVENGVSVSSLPSYAILESRVSARETLPFSGAGVSNVRFEGRSSTGVYAGVTGGTSSAYATTSSDRGNVRVLWDGVSSADWYEVEWTFLSEPSNSSLLSGSGGVGVVEELFRENSVRVLVDGKTTFYELQQVFNQGYLLVRVRAVCRRGSESYVVNSSTGVVGEFPMVLAGAWSETSPQVTRRHILHILVPHAGGQNWQYNAAFIEGGKSKEVVSYHDGLLQSRQEQTLMDGRRSVMIHEPVYDGLGRVVLDILPSPDMLSEEQQREDNNYAGVLGYRAGFNRKEDGSVIEGADVTVDESYKAGGDCSSLLQDIALSTSYGSARYYSLSNPDQQGNRIRKRLRTCDQIRKQ